MKGSQKRDSARSFIDYHALGLRGVDRVRGQRHRQTLRVLLLAFGVLLAPAIAGAQEAWCLANPSNCVMSETFQSTSYTRVADYGSGGAFLGNQSASKPGHYAGVDLSIQAVYGSGNTFASSLAISTDSGILNLLPNRNTTSVARFLRHAGDNNSGQASTYRFGYDPVPLGTTTKRLALRWYSYHSPDYEFAYQASCTNGKIAHSSGTNFSAPYFTFQSYRNATNHYSFISSGAWVWSGHSSFDGIVGGHACRPGAAVDLNTWRGKWFRHEIVVRRPRRADSSSGLGYDFSFFTKNVTDGTAEVEDVRFSSGCTSCLFDGGVPGSNFVWNTGTYPTADMAALHTELYRAGTCAGWQGWLYAVLAKWDTDAGQRIGPATEVESGGKTLAAPSNLNLTSP